jgi:ABC-type multidrug transport system ATPase subunit
MKMTDVTKGFDGFDFRIPNLQLVPGQIHGLIGPNGSGKTTAMKLMAGLLEPDGGAIDFEGLARRDITMAPRKPYFLHDSVYRNLTYPLSVRGVKPDPEQIDQYLRMIGFENRRKQYAPSLSTGEQQKLSIVRALIFSPKLILIDEALSNLDIESVGMFERLILDRQSREPVTWVVVSHQLSHIQRLCDRLIFLYNGAVEAEGPAEEMLLQPRNPQLKAYLRHVTLSNQTGDADQYAD